MKLIVRSPNWIGDCVMCLPAIRSLKALHEDSSITVVTKQYLREVFINIPEISEIETIPEIPGIRGIINTSRQLSQLECNAGILFTNSFHSALLFKLAGIPNVIGYKKDFRGCLLDRQLAFPRNDRHHIHFYLDLIEAFSGEKIKEHYSHSLMILDQELNEARQRLLDFGVNTKRPMLGVSPSAAYGTAKQWEPSSFSSLIDRLGDEYPDLQILLLGSQKEREKISIISSGASGNCFNLAGKLSLRASIVTISLCNCFLGNDSGLLHVASAVDVPYVGIFGPTIPHKTAPLASRSIVLYHKVNCAPCNYRDCPVDHRCMKAISVEEVFEAVVSCLPGA